jgi:hypothetical protein
MTKSISRSPTCCFSFTTTGRWLMSTLPDDLAPFTLRTAPLSVALAPGVHVALQSAALLLVVPENW